MEKSAWLDTEGAMKSSFVPSHYYYFRMREHLMELSEGQTENLGDVSHTSMHTLLKNVPKLSLRHGILRKKNKSKND